MISDQTLIDAFFDLYPTLTEFEKIVTQHQDFIVESLAKTVPGYISVRWTGAYNAETTMYALFNMIRDGQISLADALEAGLNTIANNEYTTAKAQLDAITGN